MEVEQPLLSIGMIVKNEIRCIEKCIKSLQPLREAIPCELVIADTGSTDGTRKIAEQYADILFDFPWVNDFSAARNAVMERCSGKWYLTVDADEYLDPDIDELCALFCEPEANWPDTCLITVRNYLTPEMHEGVCSDFYVLRMARLGVGICYRGTIHEIFTKNGDRLTPEMIGCLPNIILHHDGYALESSEAQKAKAMRNLELLDKELEQHPNDLTRLAQCIESSSAFPNRLTAYVIRSAQALQHADSHTLQDPSAPGLASHCALLGSVLHLPQAEEWIQWSKKHYPTHIATRLDTICAEIMLEYERKHYSKLPKLAKKYLYAFAQYQEKDVPILESATSVLRAADITHRYKVTVIASVALEKIGRSKKSLEMLIDWPIHQVPGECLQDWVKALVLHCDDPDAQAAMARTMRSIEENYMDAASSEWEKRQHESFQEICRLLFVNTTTRCEDEPEKAWRILLTSSGSFGLAARVMVSTDEKEISKFLAEVEDWNTFPPQALAHALQYGAIFPDSMAQQSIKWLQTTALALAETCEKFVPLVLSRKEKTDFESLYQTQLLYWMLAAALMQKENFSDLETALSLIENYANVSARYLNRYYGPDVLACPNVCCALNEIDKFSFAYLKAHSLQTKADRISYIRSLRSALRSAPQMKYLVKFLMEREEEEVKQQASPELLALAKNVSAILSRYSADDPAVAALKQSAAYQKVAYLIEEI